MMNVVDRLSLYIRFKHNLALRQRPKGVSQASVGFGLVGWGFGIGDWVEFRGVCPRKMDNDHPINFRINDRDVVGGEK